MAPLIEPVGVDVVAGGQLGVHAVDALRGPEQALAIGVLADLEQDLADGGLDLAVVGGRSPAWSRPREPVMSSVATDVSPISFSISSTRRRTLGGRSVGLDMAAMVRRKCQPATAPPSLKPPEGIGSKSRPSAPRSQARAFSPSDGRW